MPKKQVPAAAAISTLSVEEDLVEKVTQRLLAIRGSTGRAGAPKAKSDMTCYFCGKVGHIKRDCVSLKKQLKKSNYSISPICLLINEENWLCGEIKSSKVNGKVIVDTGAGVNIITKSYAENIGAKLSAGPEIRMTFANGRETTSLLQAEVEFKLGDVSSSAKFRVLTKL